MCGLYVRQVMYRFKWGSRPKWWLWRPNAKHMTQLYSNESRPVLSMVETKDLEPGYVFEEGFLNNISRPLNSRKKANIVKLAKHLSESPDLHNPKIKERLLTYIATNRCQTVPSSLFLIDPNVAKAVLRVLKPFFKGYSGHILEANAGPGILSNLLMKAKLERLRIYEADDGFLNDLYSLKKSLKSNANIFEYNLLRMRWMMNRDLEDNRERIKSAFKGIEPKPWEEPDPVLRLFIIVPHETFLILQMYDLMNQGGIYAYGRPEFFIMIPAVNFKNVSALGKTKFVYKPVLFNLLFDFSVLEDNIPTTAILPWRYKRKLDMKELKGEEDRLILVKVTAKQSLHPFIKSNQLKSLLFFVKILVYKQSQNVISALEKWAPGIGLRLIPMGYTIYTKCKTLTTEQVLELYEIFISSPEFSKESFQFMMEFDQMNNETVQEMLLGDCKVKKTDANSQASPQTVETEVKTNEGSLSEELSGKHGS